MASAFGKRLAQAREHAGLTQIELAAKVPMAQSTLASAESNGDGSRMTVQIARACGVDPYWLATGEGEMLAGAGAAAPSPHHQAPAQQAPLDLEHALPVVLGRLASGLGDYRAGQVLQALHAATKPTAPLEQIERDLLQWLSEPAASSAPPAKRQSRA